jgi:hypothetical protein
MTTTNNLSSATRAVLDAALNVSPPDNIDLACVNPTILEVAAALRTAAELEKYND